MSAPRGPKPGKRAVAAAIEAQRPPAPPADEGEQLALGAEYLPEQPRGGPGRPAGSRNRRTQDLISYLEAQNALPGVALAKVVAAGYEQLAKDLAITKEAAFERWSAIATALMPYAHPRLQQIQLDANVNDAGALHLLAVSRISEAMAEGHELELVAEHLDRGGEGDAE
jgi:hypothetical protein